MTERRKTNRAPQRKSTASKPATTPKAVTRKKARLRDWEKIKESLIKEVRKSERLTREDLAVRINAKD